MYEMVQMPVTSSLSCRDKYDELECGWQRSNGDWYVAEPHSAMPFAYGEAPNRRYLVGVAKGGSGALQLHTCPGLCSVDSVNLTAKIWRGPWVIAELCFREVDEIMCSPLRVSNGKLSERGDSTNITFQISIVFTNITDGDVVLLDDVAAQFNECSVPTKTVPLGSRNNTESSHPVVRIESNSTT
ncbi:hypothetical protein KIN20_021960 [Parelaphostrongylus tenuis]|uniref:MAM domain-containing protein n=1 Tax=Parelaphostrongylus tenuis TaxID=148309 RepID=A0AAD5N573_PARTN|nr:hypothetical protein KIN20_021960 [Parelaphostrongylus tenuis]